MSYTTANIETTEKPDLHDVAAMLQSRLAVQKLEVKVYLAAYLSDDVASAPCLEEIQVQAALEHEFTRVVKRTITTLRSIDAANLRLYEPATKLDKRQVEILLPDAIPSYSAHLSTHLALFDRPEAIPVFKDSREFKRSMRFYAIQVTPARRGYAPITFFRLTPHLKQMQRRKWFAALPTNTNAYACADDACMLFDRRVDCVLLDGHLFILSKLNFHAIFRLQEVIKVEAARVLDRLERLNLLEGFDNFRKACLNSHPARLKLMNIGMRPYLAQLSARSLVRVARKASRPLAIDGTPEKIVFWDDDDIWDILKLLDDDLVRGELSRLLYAADSKQAT